MRPPKQSPEPRFRSAKLAGLALLVLWLQTSASAYAQDVLEANWLQITVQPTVQGPNAPPAAANSQPPPTDSKSDEKPDEKKDDKADQNKTENFNIFGQATVISQWNGRFESPYSGPHSFLSENDLATSETSTLDIGLRLWGAELYFDPEIAGGLGLSDVLGIAAFPNGDITRVGKEQPTPYVAQLYLQQSFGFGGPQENVASAPNALAGTRDVSRLTYYIGKLSVENFFDGNTYSHDPRSQFMNWALMYNAAWDYPADVRGYTYGGLVEWNEEHFAFRYGIFGEPIVANGDLISGDFARAHGQVWELETRYKLLDHKGVARFMVYWNRADMGNYNQATFEPQFDVNIVNTRTWSSKYGYGLNIEQEFNKDLGGFLRWGWDDGHTETWAFTECDRTVSFGLQLKGERWCRNDDVIGLGMAIDGLSVPHRDYLAAGGLGFELGDGALDYAPEVAFEMYYALKFKNKSIWLTPDVQLIGDPGYNAARGPVVIGGARVHAEF